MAANNPMQEPLFIKEVQGHHARYGKLLKFTHSSTKAAAAMLAAAIVALIVANSGLYEPFMAFWETEFTIGFGDSLFTMSLIHIINDVFMAIFFLMIGLEIKYEMSVGELTNIRQALLPVLAAFGGVLVPIAIYLAFNASNPETAHGWGVPTATDIAFALGIMALLGNKVPNGVRVFLSTLAVADDIIAILIIAFFYGHAPAVGWLLAAGVVLLVLIAMNRSHIYSLVPYLLVGVLLWVCVFMSGIHSTIAGVLLAFTIPAGSRVNLKNFASWSGTKVKQANESFIANVPILGQADYIENVTHLSRVSREVVPPATRLERALHPWVNFAVLPLFALTNAGVCLIDGSLGNIFADPALYGVFLGLVLGKPIGIVLFSLITVKLKIANLPEHSQWMHIVGAGILGGVGFTMAIFVANLAFTDAAVVTTAKVGILSASALAGVVGFLFLWVQARRDTKNGISYITTSDETLCRQSAGEEAKRAGAEVLEEISSPLLSREIEAAQQEFGIAEVVVDLGEDNRRSDG
ncbi:MAG: Na+/H+ antiporter NhaA [Raoultibacter sp.]